MIIRKLRFANYCLSGILLALIVFSSVGITLAISQTWSELGDVAITVAQGGTGASTLTANNVILGNSTSAVQFVAPSTDDNVLKSDGSTWSSSAPTGVRLIAGQGTLSSTTYCHPTTGACGSSAATYGLEVPFAGTIQNLKFIMSTAPAASNTCQMTVRKATGCDGSFANTALTCTITGDGSLKTCTDVSNTVAISANDCLQMYYVPTTCGSTNSWSFQYVY